MRQDSDIIIALDFPGAKEALAFTEKLGEELYVKVGMELFYAAGPDLIRALKEKGHRVFLDLKLHDIPHTVERAMAVLGRLGVDMVNVHAAGTRAMMEAGLAGLKEGAEAAGRPLPDLIAVTQLTSTDEQRLREEILIEKTVEDTVLAYAGLAKEAGLAGVVCSPHEAPRIHEILGSDFLTVTPGIRFPNQSRDDQKRITTPEEAGRLGCDFPVVGRAVTGADDPVTALERCRSEFFKGKEKA